MTSSISSTVEVKNDSDTKRVRPTFDIQRYISPDDDCVCYELWSPEGRFGMLVVSSTAVLATEPDEEFLPFYFSDPVSFMLEVHPSQFEEAKRVAQTKAFEIGDVIFDGTIVYDDVGAFLRDLQRYPYRLTTAEDVLNHFVGFQSAGEDRFGKRRWILHNNAFERTPPKSIEDVADLVPYLHTAEDRHRLLFILNMKPLAPITMPR